MNVTCNNRNNMDKQQRVTNWKKGKKHWAKDNNKMFVLLQQQLQQTTTREQLYKPAVKYISIKHLYAEKYKEKKKQQYK